MTSSDSNDPINPYAAPQSDLEKDVAGKVALWNPNVASGLSFVFTPVLGSILLALNWRRLGQADKASTAWMWLVISIVATAILMALPVRIPGINVAVFFVWFKVVGKPQIEWVKKNYGKDYPKRSWLVPLTISFALLALVIWGLVAGQGMD